MNFENVEDPPVLLADLLESAANGDVSGGDVGRIGDELNDVEVELRRRDLAREHDRPERDTTAAMSRIRPV
jgi:hypothetical protein